MTIKHFEICVMCYYLHTLNTSTDAASDLPIYTEWRAMDCICTASVRSKC